MAMNIEEKIHLQDQHIGECLYQLSLLESQIADEAAIVLGKEYQRVARIIVAENASLSKSIEREKLLGFKRDIEKMSADASKILGKYMGEHMWPHKRTNIPTGEAPMIDLEKELIETLRQGIAELSTCARPIGFRLTDFPDGAARLGAHRGYDGRVDLTDKMRKLLTQYQLLTNDLRRSLNLKMSLLRDRDRGEALEKWDDL